MQLDDRVVFHFQNSVDTIAHSIELLTPQIVLASQRILECLVSEHKLLCIGNGQSGLIAMQFSLLMLHKYQHDRPGLPVICLNENANLISAIAEDSTFSAIFSKQISALGSPGDILLVISSDGKANNLVQSIQAAHNRDMNVIALSGQNGGNMTALLQPQEIEMCIPSDEPILIQQAHMMITYTLAELIDYQLFGVTS